MKDADHDGMSQLLAASLGLLVMSCAATRERAALGVTNLQAPSDLAWAGPPPADAETPRRVTDPRASEAADALGGRNFSRVLVLTATPTSEPAGAWLDYYRAAALTGLGRTDEAVETFRRAELHFGQATEGDENELPATSRTLFEAWDYQGHAVSIWGRARALYEAGRCPDARAAFAEYAAFVGPRDPRDADAAKAHGETCRTPVVLR